MSGSSKYNSFTASDIERYHSGLMSASERHALEKAALDDPFLADALEGYSLTSTPVADVNNIRERLEEKLQKKRVISLVPKKYNWLRIAALFLILAGSGWFLYRSDVFTKKEIAKAEPVNQKQIEAATNKNLSDSLPSLKYETAQAQKESVNAQRSAIASAKPGQPVRQRQKTKNFEEPKQTARTEIAAAPVIKNDVPQNEAFSTRSLARKMPDSNQDVSANVNPAVKNNNADYNNNKTINGATDSSGTIAGNIQASNDTVRNLNIVMQPSKEGMSEVVVVGLGAKKRATVKPEPHFEELQPAEGWTNFNDYLALNLKEPEEIKKKTISGDVELSFEVNNEGEAVNIKVEKSLCTTCDEEAVRLLKEGPKWKKKKTKKGKISIHF
jgi:hypothetical protein